MAAPSAGGGSSDGWNDPPLFTYNPTAPAQASQRTQLNKRVSFPLNTGSQALLNEPLNPLTPNSTGMLLSPEDGPPKLPPVHILPPSSSTSVQGPVPLLVPSMSPPIDHSALPPSFMSAVSNPQKMETMPELLERLELDSTDFLRKYTKKILHEMVDICKESIQGRSREDIQTRLGLLDDQWRDEKLTEGAKIKLGCLACALKHDDLKQADNLHLALMVDHISEVSQWMVGIKRLINELKMMRTPPPTFSPKKLFSPDPSVTGKSNESVSVTASAGGGQIAVDAQITSEDHCVDTDKLNLKPVLMPEALVPDMAKLDLDKPQEGQQQEQTAPQEQQQQQQGNGVDITEKEKTESR